MAVLLVCLTIGGCGDGDPAEPDRGPVAQVRDAALRTLGAGPADIRLGVSSVTAEYSARGGIELATDRFHVRTSVTRAPTTHFDRVLDVVGVDGETYVAQARAITGGPDGCWFDPHAPVGSLGGAASIQEAMTLVGVTVRLLRDGIRRAAVVRDRAGGGRTYRVVVNPRKASLSPSAHGSDEIRIIAPERLARHLAPIRMRVDANGLIRRLTLELQRFRPAARGPGLVRERRRERVSITVDLGDFGRTLAVRAPRCVAME